MRSLLAPNRSESIADHCPALPVSLRPELWCLGLKQMVDGAGVTFVLRVTVFLLHRGRPVVRPPIAATRVRQARDTSRGHVARW